MRPGRATQAVLIAAAHIAGAAAAVAHVDVPLAPHDLPSAWTFEPEVVIPLLLAFGLYVRGVHELWQTAGTGHGIRTWEVGAFMAGVGSLVIALISPLHAMGSVLFSAHMVQHEVMMLVSAPLLVLGRPGIAMIWGLPGRWRARAAVAVRRPEVRGIWRGLTMPVIAWLLHATALWMWHHPGFFQATLESDAIHGLQHASFLGTALVFAWTIIHPRAAHIGIGGAIIYLFTTAVHSGVLGALLTFAHKPWYEGYLATTTAWGLSPLEDQQLGGLIMWVPASAVYLFAALLLLARWISDSEKPGAAEHVNGTVDRRLQK
jgi:putative membrane protein